jgi:hypothetical protein
LEQLRLGARLTPQSPLPIFHTLLAQPRIEFRKSRTCGAPVQKFNRVNFTCPSTTPFSLPRAGRQK